jgi:hypothetical protein
MSMGARTSEPVDFRRLIPNRGEHQGILEALDMLLREKSRKQQWKRD